MRCLKAKLSGEPGTTFLNNAASRRRRARFALSAIEGLEQRLVLSTVNWTGLGGNFNWHDVNNWSTHAVPGGSDDVVINNVANNGSVQISSNSVSIRSLTTTTTGGLSIGNVTLTTSAPSQINGKLTLSASTINVGTGLTLAGQTTWTGGDINGSVTNTGSMAISGSSQKHMYGVLTNATAGTITIAPGSSPLVFIETSSSLVNQSGGTIDVQSDGPALTYSVFGFGTVHLSNAGTLKKSAGTASTGIGLWLENTGVVSATTGSLELTSGGTLGGSINVTAGQLLLNGGGYYTLQPGFTASLRDGLGISTGHLEMGEGATPVNLTVTDLMLSGGSVSGPGTLTTTRTSLWLSGTLSNLHNKGTFTASGFAGNFTPTKYLNGTLTNEGTLTIAPGNGIYGDSSTTTVINQASGTIDIQSHDMAFWGTGAIQNAGILKKTADPYSPSIISFSLTNTGVVQVDTGALWLNQLSAASLSGTKLTGGSYLVQGDGALLVDNLDVRDIAATIVLASPSARIADPAHGEVNSLAHLTTISAAGSLTLRNGANLTVPGSLTNSGALTVGASSTLTAAGYSQAAGGSLSFELGGTPASGQFGRIVTSGAANLAGTLNVVVTNGYVPQWGLSFPVMNFASRNGAFSTIHGLNYSPWIQFQTNLSANALTINTIGATPVDVRSSQNPSTYGNSVTFTATIGRNPNLAMPTGSVQFLIDGVPYGASVAVVNGVATSPAITTLAAGNHTIQANYSGDANYIADDGSIIQTVNKAGLRVTADDKSRKYGQANPTLTASYTGFVNGDGPGNLGGTLVLTTAATAASHVGQYAITPSGLTSSNYTITFVPGKLSVTPASLTITADDKSKTYGQANPTLTASYTGFVNGDGPGNLATPAVLETTATTTSPIGTYPITVSGATSADYTITFVQGTLTIRQGQTVLLVSADDLSKVYGQANPTLTVTYSGFLPGDGPESLGGSLILTTSATTASPVGQYAIVPSGLTSETYTIQFVPGTLSVTPASLTLTADDKSRDRNRANPPLTYTLSGFVNGDGPAVVSGSASLSTTATLASPAGAYPITPTLGNLSAANYEISVFVPGTLSVLPIVADVRVGWGTRSATIMHLNGRLTLPWNDIKTIDISFSDNVVVDSAALVLKDSLGNPLPISGFTYDPATYKGRWTLPTALGNDRFSMLVDGAGVHLPSPSTDIHMNNYNLGFAVLPGDFTGDGVVNAADLVGIRNQILGVGDPSLLVWADIDGNGVVDMADYNAARRWIGHHLPPE